MDIEVGSNRYRNSDGTVEVEGVPQMQLGVSQPGGKLLVSFVDYDQQGRVAAKVVDSSLQVNERRTYDLERTPTSVLLKNLDRGIVALKVELQADGLISVRIGDFLSIKAHRVEISPTEWKVDSTRLSGTDHDVKGGGIAIP